jgi:hypothetical protein
MSSLKFLNRASFLAVGCALLLHSGSSAAAQSKDAKASAEFTARTSVQTIYQNLIKAGYEWEYIRDEKMPEILIRSVDAIEAETRAYDRSLILGTFIPTYIRTFYDEIDKLNSEHSVRCMDVKFIEITFVPFVQACSKQFAGKYQVKEIVVPVLATKYTYRVCERPSCLKTVTTRFNSEFEGESFVERDFSNLCGSGS